MPFSKKLEMHAVPYINEMGRLSFIYSNCSNILKCEMKNQNKPLNIDVGIKVYHNLVNNEHGHSCRTAASSRMLPLH